MTTTRTRTAPRTAVARLRTSAGRVVAWVAVVAVAALAVFLWPVAWGGSTSLVVISGQSMQPTFDPGELVVARAGQAQVGDVVVFRPDGLDGLVVHRIVGGDAESGWVVRGDNNAWDDRWRPTTEDVVGVVRWHLPGLGRAATVLSSPTAWICLAVIAAGILLWPARTVEDEDEAEPAQGEGGEQDDPRDPRRELDATRR